MLEKVKVLLVIYVVEVKPSVMVDVLVALLIFVVL